MEPLSAALMMGAGSLLQGGFGMLGASGQASANRQAGQTSALLQAIAMQQAQQRFDEAKGYLSPFATAGQKSVDLLSQYLTGNAAQKAGVGGGGASLISTFQPTQQQLEQTPGYQFSLSQGLKATQNKLAGGGAGLTGTAQQAGIDYATGLAGTTFQQQLQNYLTQNQQAYNMLYGTGAMGAQAAQGIMSGTGTLSGQLLGAAQNVGSAYGGGLIGGANAMAGGYNALGAGMAAPLTYGGYYGAGFNRPYSPMTNTGNQPSPSSGMSLPFSGLPNVLLGGYQGPFPSSYSNPVA